MAECITGAHRRHNSLAILPGAISVDKLRHRSSNSLPRALALRFVSSPPPLALSRSRGLAVRARKSHENGPGRVLEMHLVVVPRSPGSLQLVPKNSGPARPFRIYVSCVMRLADEIHVDTLKRRRSDGTACVKPRPQPIFRSVNFPLRPTGPSSNTGNGERYDERTGVLSCTAKSGDKFMYDE